jgi:hypothetical protein
LYFMVLILLILIWCSYFNLTFIMDGLGAHVFRSWCWQFIVLYLIFFIWQSWLTVLMLMVLTFNANSSQFWSSWFQFHVHVFNYYNQKFQFWSS